MYAPALSWEQFGFLLALGCWSGTLGPTPLSYLLCRELWAAVGHWHRGVSDAVLVGQLG